VFRHIQAVVEDRYDDAKRTMRFTSISAFIFLRFFVPALLNPKLFGLTSSHPDPKCQRTLTLMAKTLQGLANMSKFGGKEPWMASMNAFVEANTSAFVDYVAHICTPSPHSKAQWTSPTYGLYSVPLATRATLRGLAHEGVPDLPHLVDQPKDLAILVAILARSPSETEATIPGNLRRRRSELSQRLFEACHGIQSLALTRARAAIQLSYSPSIRSMSAMTRSPTPRERERSIGSRAATRNSATRPTVTILRASERPSTPLSNPQAFTPTGSPSRTSVQTSNGRPSSSSRRNYRSHTVSTPPKSSGVLRRTSSSDRLSSEFGVTASIPASNLYRARADTDAANLRPASSPRRIASTSERTFTELDSMRQPFSTSRPVIAIPVVQTTTTTVSRVAEPPTGDGPYGPYPLSDDDTLSSNDPFPGPGGDMFVSVSAGPARRPEGGIWRKLRR
jgi:hypothetical protein